MDNEGGHEGEQEAPVVEKPIATTPDRPEIPKARWRDGLSFIKNRFGGASQIEGRPTLEAQLKQAQMGVAGEGVDQPQGWDNLTKLADATERLNNPNWWVPTYEAIVSEGKIKEAEEFKKDALNMDKRF